MKKHDNPPLSAEHRSHLEAEMKNKENRMHVLHIAYLNKSPFENRVPSYEDLKAAAEDFIAANYAYQKAIYGRVMVKLSAAKLLR